MLEKLLSKTDIKNRKKRLLTLETIIYDLMVLKPYLQLQFLAHNFTTYIPGPNGKFCFFGSLASKT